jgi:hypothetical protein
MVVSVHHFGFPHATQVLQVTRKTCDLNATTRRLRTVTVCALTSLPFEQASPAPPGRPAARALGRSRRSTTSAMSPSPRTPPGPHRRLPLRAMASLRNLAIGILRAHGHRNVAAALRRNARDATRVLPLLGITSP